VRPYRVVVPTPALDDHLRFLQGVEDLSFQQLIPELRVEALAIAVLPGATRLNVSRLRPDRANPGPNRFGDELAAVVGTNIALPLGAAEVRRFLDFLPGDLAGVRLPDEGVDLRVLAPDGQVVHAHRFPPNAAFAPEAVSLLRAADGTGLIILAPSAGVPAGSKLPAGIYRFDWTFRRDNIARDPGSLILSENGDRADEIVRLDLTI
jgi:hypothetical protein